MIAVRNLNGDGDGAAWPDEFVELREMSKGWAVPATPTHYLRPITA